MLRSAVIGNFAALQIEMSVAELRVLAEVFLGGAEGHARVRVGGRFARASIDQLLLADEIVGIVGEIGKRGETERRSQHVDGNGPRGRVRDKARRRSA